MEEKGLEIDEDAFSCAVCLDLLRTPVTIPCGHSYCMSCVDTHWDGEVGKKSYSCPQCRQSFSQRPVLVKNTMLAVLMDKMKKTEAPAAVVAPGSPAQGDAVCCDLCSGTRVKAVKSCLQCQVSYCEEHLQPHYHVAALKKHKLVEPTENLQDYMCPQHNEDMKMFCRTDQQCICYLCSLDEHREHDTVTAAAERTEKHKELEAYRENLLLSIKSRESTVLDLNSDIDNFSSSAKAAVAHCDQAIIDLTRLIQDKLEYVKTEIQCLQEAEDYCLRQVQDKLQQQITEMKTKCSELDSLSHTEDHLQFLQKFKSISKVSASETVYMRRTPSFHWMAIAIVSKMTKKLQTRQVKKCDPSARAQGTGSAEQPVVAPPTPPTPQCPQPVQAPEPVPPPQPVLMAQSTQTLVPVLMAQSTQTLVPVLMAQSTQTLEPVHMAQSTQTLEPVLMAQSTQTLEPVPPSQPVFMAQSTQTLEPVAPPQPVQAPQLLQPPQPVHMSQSTQTLNKPTPRLMNIIYTDKLADLLVFSREMNFDADTQHPNLKLSSNNTSVQHVSKKLRYPPHPFRFDVLQQVLGEQRLFGRCFWQVEVKYKKNFMVGVAHGIGTMRTLSGGEEQLGNGPMSFGIGFEKGRFTLLNNCDNVYFCSREPPTSSPATMRIGIFLDHRAGLLAFYRILSDDSIDYICEVQTTFWQPLLAGVYLPEINSTAKFL